MKCPKCSTPVSFFRSAAMLKTLDCKECGAVLQRSTKPVIVVALIVSGMVAIKALNLIMGYWPSFTIVVILGSLLEWKFSVLKLKPELPQQKEEVAKS